MDSELLAEALHKASGCLCIRSTKRRDASSEIVTGEVVIFKS